MIRHLFVYLALPATALAQSSLLSQHTRLANFEMLPTDVVESVMVENPVSVKPDFSVLSSAAVTVPIRDYSTVVEQAIEPLSLDNERQAETVMINESSVERALHESSASHINVNEIVELNVAEPEIAQKKEVFIPVMRTTSPEMLVEEKEQESVMLVAETESKPLALEQIESDKVEAVKAEPIEAETTNTDFIGPMQTTVPRVDRLQVNVAQLRNSSALNLMRFDESAQPKKITNTLEQMIQRALEWHPSIRQAQSQILASQENIEAAESGYYPRVSSGLNAGYRDSNGRGNESWNVSASQMLYDFGKVSSTVRSAQHGFSQEQARLLLNIDQLIEKTAFASLELMRTQEKTQIAQTQQTALTGIWQLAKERAELGASAQSDVIQALSRKEAAVALLWELEAQNTIWQKQLQSLTGANETVYLATDLPEQIGMQCQNHVLEIERVPMMQIVEGERGRALAQVDLSSAEMYPTLSLDAGYDQYLRNRDQWIDGRLRQRRSDFSFMLNMNMSLFEGGGKTAKRNAARFMLQAVDAERENVSLEVTRGFEEAQNKQLILGQRLGVLAERIESIEATQDLYKQQYIELGTRSLLDLLNTEQEIYQAKSDYIDNKYEMVKAQVACLYYGAQLRQAFELMTARAEG